MQADTYNKLFTMHGQVMVFFFLIPAVPAVLRNFLIPIMIGAKDSGFSANQPAELVHIHSWQRSHAIHHPQWRCRHRLDFLHTAEHRVPHHERGGRRHGNLCGWILLDPHRPEFYRDNSSPACPRNDLVASAPVSCGRLRDQHHFCAWARQCSRYPSRWWDWSACFIWAFSIPDLGGDPLLFQHLFWFYSHPAVYIMILPGMGVISEIMPCFSHKRLFGYRFMALALIAIAVLGFLVWAHHMFVAGISLYAALIFSFLVTSVAIPSAIKVFNWTATLYKGSISLYDRRCFTRLASSACSPWAA